MRERDGLRRRRGSSGGPRSSVGVSSIGFSQYGQTCQSGSSGALQFSHACLSFVVQTGQHEVGRVYRGAANRTAQLEAGHSLLELADLEIALPDVLQVLGRTEEHVDERAEERRDETEERRHRDQPRILDPAARVLVHPVRDREPEDRRRRR